MGKNHQCNLIHGYNFFSKCPFNLIYFIFELGVTEDIHSAQMFGFSKDINPLFSIAKLTVKVTYLCDFHVPFLFHHSH